MLINNKQDLFYSLSLTPNSQEYFNLPIPAAAAGMRMVVTGITTNVGALSVHDTGVFGFKNTHQEGDQAGLSYGWESLFDQIRIEDSTRTTNDVVMDFRFNSSPDANDMKYLHEALMLASPLPAEEYAIRSAHHLDLYTGTLGNCRMFVKTAADMLGCVNVTEILAAQPGFTAVASIQIAFVALIGPPVPPQSLRVYHVGEGTDTNIEYVYPAGTSPRSVVYTETTRNLSDIYSNGKHLTSVPETMITDYNVLRGIEVDASIDADLNQKAYLTVGSLAGQRIRYEQPNPGKLHVVAIYTEA